MSESIFRDDAVESPLQKRRRLDAERDGMAEVEQSLGESSSTQTSSSSTTVSTSTANATSTTPAGSPSVSQVLSPLLSPIIAPAPEPAPPVVTTEVAIARSQTPSDGPPNLSFVRGTLQDPEVRSIIDNLEVLQRQMRTLVDGHSSGFLVSDMAQRMLGAISDMEFAIRHQHAERLRRERGSSGTGHNVGTRDLGVPLGQELSYRYDLSGVYRHPGPGQTVGPFPGIPSVDIEAERRRLNERIENLNNLTARLYPSAGPLGLNPLLPIGPLLDDAAPPTSSSSAHPTWSTADSWSHLDSSEDRWSRERRRRRELESALRGESFSIPPSLRRTPPVREPSVSPGWGHPLWSDSREPSPPGVFAPPDVRRAESQRRVLDVLIREAEEDIPMPGTYSSGASNRRDAPVTTRRDPGNVSRTDSPMDVDDEDLSWPGTIDLTGTPAVRDSWPSANERPERTRSPGSLSRTATLTGFSNSSRSRDVRRPSGIPSPNVSLLIPYQDFTSSADPPIPTPQSASTRPTGIVDTSHDGLSRSSSEELARRREALARRRAWQQQVERASSQSRASRSQAEPSRGNSTASRNLPGIQELFGPASTSADASAATTSGWGRYLSPPVNPPRASSARSDPPSAIDEEMQDIAETIRLLEDDGPANRPARAAQTASSAAYTSNSRARERATELWRQEILENYRAERPPGHRWQDRVGERAEGGARAFRPLAERAEMRERIMREQERRRAALAARASDQSITQRLQERMEQVRRSELEHQDVFRAMFGALRHDSHIARGTPQSIVDGLPSGTYGEWARPGESEEHCPICFDDWTQNDICLRMPNCTHWFHKPCLIQWLKTARTCPTCRAPVEAERERNMFGRPRGVRITPGGRPPHAVRARNDNASSGPGESRTREGAGHARRPPHLHTIAISDGEDDDVRPLPIHRHESWGLMAHTNVNAPWRNPAIRNAASAVSSSPTNTTRTASANERSNNVVGPSGNAGGGGSGSNAPRNDGQGNGNAQSNNGWNPLPDEPESEGFWGWY